METYKMTAYTRPGEVTFTANDDDHAIRRALATIRKIGINGSGTVTIWRGDLRIATVTAFNRFDKKPDLIQRYQLTESEDAPWSNYSRIANDPAYEGWAACNF